MIERLYIHNYRCLDNFDLPVDALPSSLLVGKNGSGKSSIGFALAILQKIGRGSNRVRDLIKPHEIRYGHTAEPVRIQLEVKIGGVSFDYELALELPENFKELRVLEETLRIDGVQKFTRKVAELRFPLTEGKFATISYDWHLIWLSAAQARSEDDPLDIFRKWLARMLIVRPYPLAISGDSSEGTLNPLPDMSNFGDWWTGLLSHSPSSYATIDKALKMIMPDLKDIKNPVIAKESRSLEIQFEQDGKTMTLPFSLLSDGEKCMLIWALVMAANEAYGPLLCFWDEPDNYLAISEVGDFATDLRRAFQKKGQFLGTSHNAEVISKFSDTNTFVLFRRNHREPTQVRPLKEIAYEGDLISALVRGEIEP
jgi:predicted ATPase